MLMVIRFCSPPYSASARASAVSVLPTPLGPHNRNTPTGLPGSVSRARDVWMRRATASSASRWPITRFSSVSARASTACASSRTMRPTGMPVQSATTAATAAASTAVCIIGASPWPLTKACAALAKACRVLACSEAGAVGAFKVSRSENTFAANSRSVSQPDANVASAGTASASSASRRSTRCASPAPRWTSCRAMRSAVSSA
ncbi:hypothetical protein D3C72_1465480 [compost metagenome]